MKETNLKAMLYYVDYENHNLNDLKTFNLLAHKGLKSKSAMVSYIKREINNYGQWRALSTSLTNIKVCEENKDIIISARFLNFINLEVSAKAYIVYKEYNGKFIPLYVKILNRPIYFSNSDNVDGISFAIKEAHKDSLVFKSI